MFKLFTGKISGVLSLTLQGISKALGLVVETVTTLVDSIVETVSELTHPITDKLTELPLVGNTLGSVLDLKNNLVANLSDDLHNVADQLSQGNLLGGITTALSGVTPIIGKTVSDGVDVLESVTGLTAPVKGLLWNLPVVADVLDVAAETTSNLLGFVDETAENVASIDPLELVSGLLSNPTASIGGVVQDVSGTLDNLLNDLVPVADFAAELPIIGNVIDVTGQAAAAITDGLYDLGTLIAQVDLLDPLQSNTSFI